MADEQLYLDYEGLAIFKGELNGVDLIKATGNGNAYTATIPNVTALKRGMIITIIPDTTSTATIPNLNVNGLGAKNIKQRISTNTSLTVEAGNASWMIANKPVPLLFDGTQWVTITGRAAAQDLYGTVPLEKGGTGVNSLEDLKELVAPDVSDASDRTLNQNYLGIPMEGYENRLYCYKYGKLVRFGFELTTNNKMSERWTSYTIGSGLPAPDGDTWGYVTPAIDYNSGSSYICYVDEDGTLVIKTSDSTIANGTRLLGSGMYVAAE